MRRKYLGLASVEGKKVGIIVEANNQKEAKFLVQAVLEREFPTKGKTIPIVGPLLFDETHSMNPSKREGLADK